MIIEDKFPRVGVATILKPKVGNQVLFGKRINSHGNNTWSTPGGHLEKFESFYDCAKRELNEETGLVESVDFVYENKNPVAITNDFFEEEKKHYITIFLEAIQISGNNAKIMEPNKCSEWVYSTWEYAKNNYNLFLPIQNLIKLDYNPFRK